MSVGIGLDFGTTNSAMAIAADSGEARVALFDSTHGTTASFRSVLYFGREEHGGPTLCTAGPEAIARYLEMDDERRLMQSLKSFLASRLFKATSVFGKMTTLEELIARIVRQLHEESMLQLGDLVGPVIVGRPVRFAKALDEKDDHLATRRQASRAWRSSPCRAS